MKRRDFITTGSLGALGLSLSDISVAAGADNKPADSRKKILISGGGLNRAFLKYLAELTGKKKPRLCFLPTAAADDPRVAVYWYQLCAELNVVPYVQDMFISSYYMKESFEDVKDIKVFIVGDFVIVEAVINLFKIEPDEIRIIGFYPVKRLIKPK